MLVVGMHRSGTSAVTRALAAMGFDLGADPLMAATDDNPAGHFEVARLSGLDDELLDALGGRWSAPPPAPPSTVAALAETELGDRALELTAEVFGDRGWVWKDPRASLLLPFWRAVLRPDPIVVVVVRHPLEVARSLRARDGIALDYGLALWERYTRTLLRDLAGLTVFVVDFDAALDDPERVVGDLVEFLAGTEIGMGTIDVESGGRAFVGGHRHQMVTESEFAAESAATDELRSLHRLASGLVGAHEPFERIDLGPETPRLQMAFTEHKRLSEYEEQVLVLDAELALCDSRIGDLRTEIDRRSEQAGVLAAETMALREERTSLSQRLIDLESWWPVLTALRVRRVLRRITRRD